MNFEDLIEKQGNALEKQNIENTIVKISEIEAKLQEAKELEKEQKKLKDKLLKVMVDSGTLKWETPNHIKIAVIEAIPDSTEVKEICDEGKFMSENQELWNTFYDTRMKYIETTEVPIKGRKSYLRITLPKEK